MNTTSCKKCTAQTANAWEYCNSCPSLEELAFVVLEREGEGQKNIFSQKCSHEGYTIDDVLKWTHQTDEAWLRKEVGLKRATTQAIFAKIEEWNAALGQGVEPDQGLGTEPQRKRIRLIHGIGEAAQSFERRPTGLLPPQYLFQLHNRNAQLKQIAEVIIANFIGRTSAANAAHGNLLIPGGFCFGKSRLGYEAQFVNEAILLQVQAFNSMPSEDRTTLLEALKKPIYIYLDLSDNGVKMNHPLDVEAGPSLRLGLRLASRGWLGIPLSEITAKGPEVWKLFDVPAVLTCIIEEALAERANIQDEEAPIFIIVHFDEYQAYIDRCSAVESITDPREHFKDMLRELADFAKKQQQTKLANRFFILPICTGTSAIDIHFLPTEAPRRLINLTPLSKESVKQMAFEKWPDDASSMLASPLWDIAVGDSMGIPRFVEWMLQVAPDSYDWSAAIYRKLLTYDAFDGLAHFGGSQGAETLLALALTEHPVRRNYSLGACGSIGKVERSGAIYLVPSSQHKFLVGIPFPVCKLICRLLSEEGNSVMPDDLMRSPSLQCPWRWQDFELLYPYFQSLIIRSLKLLRAASLQEAKLLFRIQAEFMKDPEKPQFKAHKERQPEESDRQRMLQQLKERLDSCQAEFEQHFSIEELFRGAQGDSALLKLRLQLPPSVVYKEKDKFLVKKTDVAKLEDVLCEDDVRRALTGGIFLCAEGNAIFDSRFACLPVHPATKRISIWVQTKHSDLHLDKPARISSPELRRWYDVAMASLADYAAQDEVVVVFITNRRFKPKGNQFGDLFVHCPRLVLLAEDDSRSLCTFLGKTFAHRGLLAQHS